MKTTDAAVKGSNRSIAGWQGQWQNGVQNGSYLDSWLFFLDTKHGHFTFPIISKEPIAHNFCVEVIKINTHLAATDYYYIVVM